MSQPTVRGIPSPHVRRKRRRRRAEILRAALAAFREHGYHSTTLDDIAGRLDVRKTALYHYFPDKESIFYECHRRSLAEVLRQVQEAHRLHDTPAERLRYVVREHVRVMTDTLGGSPLAFEVPALTSPRQERIVAARDRYERCLRDLIVAGIQQGELKSVNPKVAVFVILGAINWIARWYRADGSLQSNEIGLAFADHLVGGLTCPVPR